ncbi:MAG TPA: hypothetical protein VE645_11215 [Pseudonocardiaceae bacterium]|nr:hypothetical protein [Pseudonocardiaceae bacterium]
MRTGGLEVALAGALLGSFLTIPAYWAHLTFGAAFVLLASVHIGRRRRLYLAVLRRRHRRAVVSAVLVARYVGYVVTGSPTAEWGRLISSSAMPPGPATRLRNLRATRRSETAWSA